MNLIGIFRDYASTPKNPAILLRARRFEPHSVYPCICEAECSVFK